MHCAIQGVYSTVRPFLPATSRLPPVKMQSTEETKRCFRQKRERINNQIDIDIYILYMGTSVEKCEVAAVDTGDGGEDDGDDDGND